MENLETTNQRIAKNLTYYRKSANLTQAELAQKINYSDKSVSKWESGNGVPDIYILLKLAELYGVTVDKLVYENAVSLRPNKKDSVWNRLFVMLLSSGLVWLVTTTAFVVLNIFLPGKPWWQAFMYAVPVNAIVITALTAVWKYKTANFAAVTVLIWSALACVYITSCSVMALLGNDSSRMWLLFLLGVPLQALEVLWVFFRINLFKGRLADEREKRNDQKQK